MTATGKSSRTLVTQEVRSAQREAFFFIALDSRTIVDSIRDQLPLIRWSKSESPFTECLAFSKRLWPRETKSWNWNYGLWGLAAMLVFSSSKLRNKGVSSENW